MEGSHGAVLRTSNSKIPKGDIVMNTLRRSLACVLGVAMGLTAVASNAQHLLGLASDQVVVAQGTGSVDDVGTFVFDAKKIFVRPN